MHLKDAQALYITLLTDLPRKLFSQTQFETNFTKETYYSLIPVCSLPPSTLPFRVVKEHGIRSEGINIHMRCLSNI